MTVTMIATSVFLVLQTGKGAIEGVVIDSITNKPIAGAQITATKVPAPPTPAGAQVPTGIIGGVTGGVITGGTQVTVVAPSSVAGPPVQIAPVRTNASGQFSFRELEPGTYLLRASAEGYAQQEYNPRPGPVTGMSAQVNLSAGQSVTNVAFRLVPGGTVSGRVTGPNGEPLVNIEVSLLRSAYDVDGRKTLQQRGVAQTNDRGEYRIFWIAPGAVLPECCVFQPADSWCSVQSSWPWQQISTQVLSRIDRAGVSRTDRRSARG